MMSTSRATRDALQDGLPALTTNNAPYTSSPSTTHMARNDTSHMVLYTNTYACTYIYSQRLTTHIDKLL